MEVDRSDNADAPYEDQLLSRFGQVRSFARSLTTDATLADDIAQETLVRALTNRPVDHPRLGAWLSTVARNRAYQEYRSTRRRSRRETMASWFTASPSSDMGEAERNDMIAAVRDAVLELDEPYRTTVVLRHFHDLTPTEIAKQLDTPVKTIKTRLSRGHVRLRDKLERRLGARHGAWALLVCLRVDGDSAESPLPTAGWRILAAVVLAFVGVRPWLSGHRAESLAVSVDAPAEVRAIERPPESHRPGTPTRQAPAAAPSTDVDRRPTATFRGRVVTLEGVPAPLAEVTFREHEFELSMGQSFPAVTQDMLAEAHEADLVVVADRDGRFAVSVPEPPPPTEPRRSHGGFPLLTMDYGARRAQLRGLLFARTADHTSLSVALVDGGNVDDEQFLVVARRSEVHGRAVGPDGLPRAGTGITWSPPYSLRERIGVPLSNSIIAPAATSTADDGTFVLSSVPMVPDSEIAALYARRLSDKHAAPATPRAYLVFDLHERTTLQPAVVGEIRDGVGRPVHWAAVTDGANVATADEAGRYRLDAFDLPVFDHLVAIARGYQPVTVPLRASDRERTVNFTLDRDVLSIEGRVVNPHGQPMAGVHVGVEELTPLWDGTVETPVCVEHVLEMRGPDPLVGGVTDGEGRFVITGLADRRYRLRAAREGSTLFARSAPVTAGAAGVQLIIPTDGPLHAVEGRLVSREGEPLRGASVRAVRELSSLPRPGSDRAPLMVRLAAGETTTDALGRFRLECHDRTGLLLEARADGFVPQEWSAEIGDEPPPGRVLYRACRFRVDADQATRRPERFCLVDDQQREVEVEVRRGAWTSRVTWAAVTDGRSEVVIAPETVRRVRLRYGTEVVERDITLLPAELVTLTL